MGVKDLWSLLRSANLVQEFCGSDDHPRIANEVHCKVIAVDISQWIFHANSQPDLLATFTSPEARCLKVAFERAINWLRYGCVPVGCLDGDIPPEKEQLLRQRFQARTGREGGGTGNYEFQRLGLLISRLLQAMGLPVITAPEEAEALMAALEQAGLVHACATSDGDALVFGSSTVYHTLKLQTLSQKLSEVAKVDMRAVRRTLGLQRGGSEALCALASLTGGDYDTAGLDQVGKMGAIRIICHLLQGHEDDEGVMDRLAEALARPPDPALAGLTSCTGCARCKHGGHTKGKIKHHHARNMCQSCGSTHHNSVEHTAASQSAKGSKPPAGPTCQPRPEAACACPFHASEEARRLDKVVRLAHKSPGFAARASAAKRGYKRQRAAAAAAVARLPQQRLEWIRRPDCRQVHAMVGPYMEWDLQKLRRKLLPLLLTWDAAHPGDADVEFAPVKIAKLQGNAVGKIPTPETWRYLMAWQRLPCGSQQERIEDEAWLAEGVPDARALRMELVAQHWPELVAAFNRPPEKAAKPRAKARGLKQGELAGMASAMSTFLNTPPKHSSTTKPAKTGVPTIPLGHLPSSPCSPSKRTASHIAAACTSLGQQQQQQPQQQPGSSSSHLPAVAPQPGIEHSGQEPATPRGPQQQHGTLESPSKRRKTPPPSPGGLPAPLQSDEPPAHSGDESPSHSAESSPPGTGSPSPGFQAAAPGDDAHALLRSPGSSFLPTPSQRGEAGLAQQPHAARKSLAFDSPSLQATAPQQAGAAEDTDSPSAGQVQDAWLAVGAGSPPQAESHPLERQRVTDLTCSPGGGVIDLCTPPGSQSNALLDLTHT